MSTRSWTLTDFIGKLAVISDCGRYRYWLQREFGLDGTPLTAIMLNPSTADARVNDQTIRKCIHFATLWGHTSLIVVNLFAWRSTDPGALLDVDEPVGPLNDDAIYCAAEYARTLGGRVLCAWGRQGGDTERWIDVLDLIKYDEYYCLGTCKNGQPRHPLYVRSATQPRLWK